MTNYEAVKAQIAPFTADKLTIEKEMIDAGINSADSYSASGKTAIAQISVNVLNGFLALASESEGGFSRSFDKEGLRSKIDSISRANNLSVSDVSNIIRDKSDMW